MRDTTYGSNSFSIDSVVNRLNCLNESLELTGYLVSFSILGFLTRKEAERLREMLSLSNPVDMLVVKTYLEEVAKKNRISFEEIEGKLQQHRIQKTNEYRK